MKAKYLKLLRHRFIIICTTKHTALPNQLKTIRCKSSGKMLLTCGWHFSSMNSKKRLARAVTGEICTESLHTRKEIRKTSFIFFVFWAKTDEHQRMTGIVNWSLFGYYCAIVSKSCHLTRRLTGTLVCLYNFWKHEPPVHDFLPRVSIKKKMLMTACPFLRHAPILRQMI